MSYARLGPESDVYVYDDCDEGLTCWNCSFCQQDTDEHYLVKSANEMILHLEEHLKSGHKVPAYAFESLRRL